MSYLILSLCPLSFALAFILTLLVRSLALKIGFVDKPGGRKIHANPKPLGGGIAIFWGITLPILAALAFVHFFQPPHWLDDLLSPHVSHTTNIPPQSLAIAYWDGIRLQTPMAIGILAAAAILHILGLVDDRKALGPMSKLIIQLAVVAVLVVGLDMRSMTFLDHLLPLGRWPSILVTILWIAGITNAFNFLDNMDGLSAGVAAVCTLAFLVTALGISQWFVAAGLALLLGSLLGFLCFNFPPATIFMGDAGSLVIGLFLGVLTVRTTYIAPEIQSHFASGWYALFAPLIVMAVPLYDLIVVSALRIRAGKSPFVGDANHLSHRLVARGMSRRTAVLCIYLITAATALAAVVLTQVRSTHAAILIFAQTVLILAVVALLEQHPIPIPKPNNSAPNSPPSSTTSSGHQ
jgi:UDP-GlcNAc:undecaprenyl-phosphate GlcNAc-1-phosphate transferase